MYHNICNSTWDAWSWDHTSGLKIVKCFSGEDSSSSKYCGCFMRASKMIKLHGSLEVHRIDCVPEGPLLPSSLPLHHPYLPVPCHLTITKKGKTFQNNYYKEYNDKQIATFILSSCYFRIFGQIQNTKYICGNKCLWRKALM